MSKLHRYPARYENVVSECIIRYQADSAGNETIPTQALDALIFSYYNLGLSDSSPPKYSLRPFKDIRSSSHVSPSNWYLSSRFFRLPGASISFISFGESVGFLGWDNITSEYIKSGRSTLSW